MLLDLCKFNVWANHKITGYILSAGDDATHKELVSSFPTILKTLLHIWDAQQIWYARLQGNTITTWPSKDFKGTLKDACNGLMTSSNDFVRLTEKFENDFSIVINYKTLDGNEFSNTAEEIIMHCMNHGTYHRGQIITMLRQVGFTEVGSTDYIRYCREKA